MGFIVFQDFSRNFKGFFLELKCTLMVSHKPQLEEAVEQHGRGFFNVCIFGIKIWLSYRTQCINCKVTVICTVLNELVCFQGEKPLTEHTQNKRAVEKMSPVIDLMSFLKVGTCLKLMRLEKISVAGNLFECLEGKGIVNKITFSKYTHQKNFFLTFFQSVIHCQLLFTAG